MPNIGDHTDSAFAPIALEEPSHRVRKNKDRRPRMEEPPPVSLVAVADVVLPATCGLEHLLDDFYLGIFEFQREEEGKDFCYRADNFALRFTWHEGLVQRDSLRPLGIEIASLDELARKLTDHEIEFQYERGLAPGSQSILLLDPAGNTLQVYERRIIG
ncbi:MAG TPA: hypothetical protein VGG19_20435 [Tepidisphaeraceae bacterium]|jgi:hypothetical protein